MAHGKMEQTLEQIQRLVSQLDHDDRRRLLKSFETWIVHTGIEASPDTGEPVPANDAWQKFFELGATLAEADRPAEETLTSALLRMRR
jgi:hypothetical protein